MRKDKNMAHNQNFQVLMDEDERNKESYDEKISLVKEFMNKVGTTISSDQFDEALEIINILSKFGTEEDRMEHSTKLSLIICAGVVDAKDDDQKAERQQVYKDHPWISPVMATNNPAMSSIPS